MFITLNNLCCKATVYSRDLMRIRDSKASVPSRVSLMLPMVRNARLLWPTDKKVCWPFFVCPKFYPNQWNLIKYMVGRHDDCGDHDEYSGDSPDI
jgi:hypothetical protein